MARLPLTPEQRTRQDVVSKIVGDVIVGPCVAIILLSLLVLAAKKLPWITANVTPGILIPAVLVVSGVLYAVREFYRSGYAILEIFIGCALIGNTLLRASSVDNVDLLTIQLAAGIYIIIRGLDNLRQSHMARILSAYVRRKKN